MDSWSILSIRYVSISGFWHCPPIPRLPCAWMPLCFTSLSCTSDNSVNTFLNYKIPSTRNQLGKVKQLLAQHIMIASQNSSVDTLGKKRVAENLVAESTICSTGLPSRCIMPRCASALNSIFSYPNVILKRRSGLQILRHGSNWAVQRSSSSLVFDSTAPIPATLRILYSFSAERWANFCYLRSKSFLV